MEQLCCLPKQCSLTFVILTLSEAMRKDLCILLSLRCCTSARNSLDFVILKHCDFLHGATLLLAKAMLSHFCHPDAERSDAEGPMHFAFITLLYISTKLSRFCHPERL